MYEVKIQHGEVVETYENLSDAINSANRLNATVLGKTIHYEVWEWKQVYTTQTIGEVFSREEDGEAADIRYRADMKDAGRGHLVR